MGQGRHTLRSVSDPVYPHVLNETLSLYTTTTAETVLLLTV